MRVSLTCLFLMVPAALAAHDGAHDVPASTSIWDALAVVLLCGAGILYATGQRRLALRGARQRRVEPVAFWVGVMAMFAAVLPPLDHLAAERFSAHMLQHELLMLVGTPLMVAGRPMAVWLWGLPDSARLSSSIAFRDTHSARLWAILTAPAVAWALHGGTVWLWHLPVLYEWAVQNEAVHAVQHATFVGTSVLFWWGLVYGRYGRAGYGASVFYVFTTVVHTGILGALFTLSTRPFYAIYAARTSDPVADQQRAGLVMWIPAGLVLTLAGIALFAAWLGESERRLRQSAVIRDAP
jgi:putative membrane protein